MSLTSLQRLRDALAQVQSELQDNDARYAFGRLFKDAVAERGMDRLTEAMITQDCARCLGKGFVETKRMKRVSGGIGRPGYLTPVTRKCSVCKGAKRLPRPEP